MSSVSDSDAFLELKSEWDTLIKNLVNKRSEAIRVTIEAAGIGVASATVSAPFHFLAPKFIYSVFGREITRVGIFGGPPSVHAGNMALATGVAGGVYWIVNSVRGKEDYKSGLVATAALVNGVSGGGAIATGLLFGLGYGELFKNQEKDLQQEGEEVLYNKTKEMLSRLDLQHYENNFKRGSITDRSLPYISDSDLKEVKIPVGPRRIILDHIQREKDEKIGGEGNEV